MIAINSDAQNATIRLSSKNMSIARFFDEIEKQTDYLVVYSNSEVNTGQSVTFDKTSGSVSEYLHEAFSESELNYEFENDYIVLSKRAILQSTQQTGRRISGKVSDASGEAIIGASVIERGTSNGVATDVGGNFSLNVGENAVLRISYLGYITQEVAVGNQTQINVTLNEDTQSLDEVVVVGYGTQKKVNLTGAIATVGSREFENRPITNAADALQGKVANLNVYNSDGGPGSTADFNIRGYAGKSGAGGATYTPLIIVDGVTGYFDDLNPNDIEAVTVLKDAASSAIYGAQAAYGVILVTTKSGKRNQKATITYNNNLAWHNPTVLPKTAGSLEFARLFREASINEGGGGVIDSETMDRIEKYYNDPTSIPNNVPQLSDPERWSDWGDGRSNANEDWANAMFKKWQMNQTHNLSIQGGTDRSSYMMSIGYLHSQGKLRYYDDYYERFNVASRLSVDITNWLTVGMNFRYAKDKNDTPAYYMEPNGGINSLINWIWVVWPTIPVLDPNGHFSPAGRMAFIGQANPHLTYTDNFWGTGTALFKILPGLTANLDFTYNKWMNKLTYSKGLIYSWSVSNEPYMDSSSPQTTQIWQNAQNDDFISTQFYTTYEKEFGDHSFKIMGGMQQENKNNYSLSADKRALILPEQPSISTATGVVAADDALDHWATRGFFGRINYFYKSKYLLELNVRKDGSSRYYTGQKWGTFPGISAAWNIAREDFFQNLQKYVSELKFRVSYGELGNMRGVPYQYISTISYNPTSNYIMGGERIGAFGTPGLIAYNTWETNRSLDFGLDIMTLNNRLTAAFDWYQRDIIGLIAQGESLPAVLGARSPSTNNADLRTRGFDLSLSWRDQLTLDSKPLTYRMYVNLSDYRGKVLKYSNPSGLLSDWYVGKDLGEIWGYTSDHIMIDADEAAQVNSSGFQSFFGSNWSKGDMKYKDIDGSGKIDNGTNTLDNPGDQSIIGNNTPRYNYGFGFSAEWNGFDLGALFQGTGKRDMWLSGRLSWGLGGGQWGSNVWKNTLDSWREDESNLDPYWPKFYLSSTGKNLRTQTKYLNSAAYCRLKNLQFGYTIPKSVTQKISMEKCRIYFSGENLFTFSRINENFDPEAPGDNVYPLTKSVSVGFNITF
ncbi:MAG: TonB-dependent receptor [Tannerella sp.]|nr:TonB-dependent receptor [Tannerella sp.]